MNASWHAGLGRPAVASPTVFVIVAGGKEIEIIFAAPGNLNAFTLRKQHLSDEGD